MRPPLFRRDISLSERLKSLVSALSNPSDGGGGRSSKDGRSVWSRRARLALARLLGRRRCDSFRKRVHRAAYIVVREKHNLGRRKDALGDDPISIQVYQILDLSAATSTATDWPYLFVFSIYKRSICEENVANYELNMLSQYSFQEHRNKVGWEHREDETCVGVPLFANYFKWFDI